MAREPNIPLFLWVAAAIVTHLTWGGGADQVAQVFEERADVRRFAASVDRQVRQRFATEISLLDDDAQPDVERPRDETQTPSGQPDDKAAKPPLPDPDQKKEERAEPDRKAPDPDKEKQKPLPKDQPKPQQKPEPEKQKPKPPPEPEKKDVPLPRPQAQIQQRVAVVQHVEDQKQADNPEAEFVGDNNNKVQEQTQAHVTATDQDNEKPTPGSQHSGPTDNPGDSHVSDVAQSDDSPGELNKAPSEDKLAAAKSQVSVSQPQGIPQVAGRIKGGPAKSDPGEKGQTAQAATRAQEAMPAASEAPDGAWQLAEEREARLARVARDARRHREAAARGNPDRPLDFLGLGAPGQTELGVNLNLTPGTALAAIGQDQLQREIVADGERRRSKHQGSWKAIGIERWRPAIENYVATVKLGNQTALNTAAVPFATYLNHIHNRLHPIFAINYLGFLDSLPGSAGLHNNEMATNLEIVLSQANGSIVKMGVTRTSGVTAFDISALESVQRASPFGAPPPSIVSPDGNVYLHWEFHRNPTLACSTYFARPFILKVPQKTAPPSTEPPKGPFGPEEGTVPAKQGAVEPAHAVPPASVAKHGSVPETDARLTSYAAP
jgi:hypothetical protein